VNLLLVDADEIDGDGVVTLADRRAQHLRAVLGVTLGQAVRAGLVGGARGSAVVIRIDGDAIALRFRAIEPPSRPTDVELVLAVPRPKVVTRAVEIAASFAPRAIALTNAWRVDKSYLASPRLAPDALAYAARIGAEQGATTHVAPIAVHDRLMALLDARFAAPDPAELRVVLHPDAPPLERVVTRRAPLALAIGPEGGWIDRELETLTARGFQPASLGAPILRVEAAIAAAFGQLALLDRVIT